LADQFRSKSVGEGGINGVGVVIAAAIDDDRFARWGDAAAGDAATGQSAIERDDGAA
jgi:hypothetical protein